MGITDCAALWRASGCRGNMVRYYRKAAESRRVFFLTIIGDRLVLPILHSCEVIVCKRFVLQVYFVDSLVLVSR